MSSFVPCVCWVPKGVAKEIPDKVSFNRRLAWFNLRLVALGEARNGTVMISGSKIMIKTLFYEPGSWDAGLVGQAVGKYSVVTRWLSVTGYNLIG